MFRPRKRMARHEMHALGQVGRDLGDDVALDRAHIRHRRAGFQMRRDLARDGTHHAHGHAQNHEIGVPDSLRRGVDHAVTQADLSRGFACLGRARGAHDLARKPRTAHRMRHGARDQAQTDQGDAIVNPCHRGPRNSLSTPSTASLSCGRPTVMRRQWGRP